MYRKKKNKQSRFAAIPWEIIDGQAWQELTNAARVGYVHLKRQVTSPNPGELELSYRKMSKIMDPHTFSNALRQLEKIGFITKEQHGGLFRRKNVFRLSEEWRRYGQSSTVKNHSVIDVEIHSVEDTKHD